MTILGRGDLSPPRRHRSHGLGRVLLVLVLLAGLGAAGWFGYDRWLGDDGDTAAVRPAPTPCASPTPITPADPSKVTVRVLNGTTRIGLAHRVAHQLKQQGFHVTKVGNAPHKVHATTLSFRRSDAAAALAVAVRLGPARYDERTTGSVTVELGRDFRGLPPSGVYHPSPASELFVRAAPSPCPSS